jgi:hypothetical protein
MRNEDRAKGRMQCHRCKTMPADTTLMTMEIALPQIMRSACVWGRSRKSKVKLQCGFVVVDCLLSFAWWSPNLDACRIPMFDCAAKHCVAFPLFTFSHLPISLDLHVIQHTVIAFDFSSAMAKSRADGTPAKAGRKALPAKATKASPAKSAKSKATTLERTTRSSPRRTVPSAKAQEAAADHVQTGRIAKKTSPSKATTPAKKASPKETVKATTPAKETSPKKAASTKKSPNKSTPTKTKKATSPEEYREFVRQFEDSNRWISNDFARYAIRHGIIKRLETEDAFDQRAIVHCYNMLLQHKAELDGNARASDDELTRQVRSMYRKIKKNMRSLLGAGFDECLKGSTSMEIFAMALRTGLEEQGHVDANGIVPRDLEISCTSMPEIHVTAEILERVKRANDRVVERRAEYKADFEASGLTREEYRDQVLAGRVVKPASRAASRSRSPAKSPTKREREESASRPVRARSKSPKKAGARKASKSPAPVGRPATRSRSPADIANKQPAGTGRKSRSKSPAKAPTRRVSKSPAPIETTKTRARSPVKAKEASPALLKVTKTRSRSPVKADASPATGRTRGASKSPARRDSLYQPTGDDDEDEPGRFDPSNLIKANILTPHQHHSPKRPQKSPPSNDPPPSPTQSPPHQSASAPPPRPKPQHQHQSPPEPEVPHRSRGPNDRRANSTQARGNLTPTSPAAAASSRPQTRK